MFGSIGTGELLIIILVILLVFGRNELPQVVRRMVKIWHDLQKSTQKVREEIREILEKGNDLSG